jgi:hypothetical protein
VCCALAALPEAADAQLWGVDVLARLPAALGAGGGDMLPWAVVLVAAALRAHPSSAAMQQCGLQTLTLLVAQGGEVAEAASRAGGAAAARAAMEAHGEAVQDAAARLLQLLPAEDEMEKEEEESSFVSLPASQPTPLPPAPAPVAAATSDMDAVYQAAMAAIAAAAASSCVPRSGEEAFTPDFTPTLAPVYEQTAAPVSVPVTAKPQPPTQQDEAEGRNTWRPKRM